MKVSKILSKRALSLFIVGLFVFTAFAVIKSGGTDTASIHSVSPTSILPYTTTSNGLTYTVEPNGTYLWNGHYLLDPPVPYPKVPTIAPDGLPYGSVGETGAQNKQGAYSFTKGTPSIIGISPSTVTGTDTVISENTYWNNETLYIVGNITIDSGFSLYLNNTELIFKETSTSTAYNYGIYDSNGGVSYFISQKGSEITQCNATTNSFFICHDPSYASGIYLNNTTIRALSYGDGRVSFYSASYDSFIAPVDSTFTFGENSLYKSVHNTYSGGITSKESPEIWGNNTINNSALRFRTASSDDTEYLNYTTIINETDIIHNAGGVSSNGVGFVDTFYSMSFSHDLFKNINLTELYRISDPDTSTLTNATVQNSTFENIYQDKFSGSYYSNGELFGGKLSPANTIFLHNSIFNVSARGNEASVSIVYSTQGRILYNYINGAYGYNNSESTLLDLVSGNISYNVGINIFDPWISPYSYAGDGTLTVEQSSPSEIAFILGSGTNSTNKFYATNNFAENVTVIQGAIKIAGGQDAYVLDNTVVNSFDSSSVVAVGTNSGEKNVTVSGNTVYGLYNYSSAYETTAGSASNITFANNKAYDVDATSWVLSPSRSRDINIENESGSLIGVNFYYSYGGSNRGGSNNFFYTGNSTTFSVIDSSISKMNLSAFEEMGQVVPAQWVNATPNAFNITVDNSYVPSSLLQMAYNFSTGDFTYPPYSWTGLNPDFLNLTGYLGIYSGQTYTLNASNIKNEASLPIYYSGNEIADIPASSAHYNFTALGVDKYSISTPSSKSDPVKLYFHGIADALYDVEMISNGTIVSTFTEYANATGVLNTTYNPSTMPLDPIFTVAYVGSVASPPVVPPLVPIVPHVLFGIPYLNVIVLFGGIALASEEFFRTEAKGKERKYSYTGIFVGIMIAGIGLMSVL